MKKYLFTIITSLFVLVAAMMTMNIAQADHYGKEWNVEVKIKNITKGQVITPPVIMSHKNNFSLFDLGEPASASVIELAEDGVTGPLESEISSDPKIYDYAVSDGPLLPGESVTLELTAHKNYRNLSAIGMLASTNDAFFAIRNAEINRRGKNNVHGLAYDAGSENNSESCNYIPGPPCGNAFMRDTVGAEGFVHVHSGIHGIGDLSPEELDWHNPVVEITIKRVMK
ncbi:MAG: hypothetical protein GY777_03575 [Candidatus Brocadiaceae bacterium]|nr:hypothetical protein [Candidatus Brocadiaceae bacterium]